MEKNITKTREHKLHKNDNNKKGKNDEEEVGEEI
jgi:hypothetical protein